MIPQIAPVPIDVRKTTEAATLFSPMSIQIAGIPHTTSPSRNIDDMDTKIMTK